MIYTFQTWLESQYLAIEPHVLRAYDTEFRKQLERVIQRTHNPKLRTELEHMLDCNVRDRRGNCRSFSQYIYSALIRNGIHNSYDLEAALQYIVEKMLLDRSEMTGEPKQTLFTGFVERPGYLGGNPLMARFMRFLDMAIRNIKGGRIPRLRQNQGQGWLSIGQGRKGDDESRGTVSPDEIAGRADTDADLKEMIADITTWLRRKEASSGLPLVRLFDAIMAGRNSEQQRKIVGDTAARVGRPIVISTIKDYAQKTENYTLLNLLRRYEGFQSNKPMPTKRTPPKTTTPKLEPGKESDFASIVSVIERLGRPAGSSDLMRYRRRWVDYPPRTQKAGYKNRLEEVLDLAVKEGVLKAIKTAKATIYGLGPNADQYSLKTAGTA